MSIHFTCPHCGAETDVDEQYAGTSGPCRSCGKTVTVPGTPPAAQTAPPKPSSSSGMPVALIVVASVLLVVFLCGGVLLALLLPAVQAAREAARRMSCQNNVKQIALAMHNYHDVHGTLPAPYIPDENGRPMHSWRVALLPYLERQDLYERYDFDKPWDSPENQAVLAEMPSTYACPSEPLAPGETNYMVLVGPGTLFDDTQLQQGEFEETTFRDVIDGTSLTIMIVEVPGQSVPWGKPQDIDVAGFQQALGSGAGHPGGTNVSMADGSVRFFPEDVAPQTLHGLSTKAGEENVSVP